MLLCGLSSAARMSTTGMPEMRRSCVSGGDRKTRRLVCCPSGFAIRCVSLGGASVKASVPRAAAGAQPEPARASRARVPRR